MGSVKNYIKKFLNIVTGTKLFKNRYPGDNNINKILIISLYFPGDLLFHTAVIEYIKRYLTDAEIDLWTKSSSAKLIESDNRLKDMIIFDNIKTAGYRDRAEYDFKGKLKFLKTIRNKKYDLVIDLTGKYSTGLFTLFSNAKYTAGINYNYFGFCYDKFIYLNTASQKGHLIEKYLHFTNELFNKPDNFHQNELKIKIKPYLSINENYYHDIISKLRKELSIQLRNYVVIHLTSGWAAKELSLEKFSEIIMYLNELGKEYYFIGDNKDKEKLSELNRMLNGRIHNLESKYLQLSFIESAALIKSSALFIGSDSAPLHLAAAFEIPSIALFGPTNPRFSAPQNNKTKVIYHELSCSASAERQYCTRNGGFSCPLYNCMISIKSTEIVSAIDELLIFSEREETNVQN